MIFIKTKPMGKLYKPVPSGVLCNRMEACIFLKGEQGNMNMNELESIVGSDLLESFSRIAMVNNTTPEDVISDFIKDYVVSGGHPEKVVNRWPWNKKD